MDSVERNTSNTHLRADPENLERGGVRGNFGTSARKSHL